MPLIKISLDDFSVSIPSTLVLKRRSAIPIEVSFTKGDSIVELPSSFTGALGINCNGDLVAFSNSWTKFGTGSSAIYEFDVNLNTEAMDAAITGGATDFKLEVQWGNSTQKFFSGSAAIKIEDNIILDTSTTLTNVSVVTLPAIIQNKQYEYDLTATDGDGNPIDFRQGSILAQIRASAGDKTLLGQFTITIDPVIHNKIILSLTPTQTALLPATDAGTPLAHDAFYTYPSGSRERLIKALIPVEGSVTQFA